MANYYETKKQEDLTKRIREIKIQNIDFTLDETRDFVEFVKDFKIFTKASKEMDMDKYDEVIREIHLEIQKLNFHRNDIKKQLVESGTILKVESNYTENYDNADLEDYEFKVVLPATNKCDQLTIGPNFEASLENKIRSFKDDIYQIELELNKTKQENDALISAKKELSLLKDHNKRRVLADKIKANKKYIDKLTQSFERIQGGLKELELQWDRINSIHPEDRMLISQLISESYLANWTLANKFDDMQYKIEGLKNTPYPYDILSFLKLYPNATRHIYPLKKFAEYLENNGVSSRDINGYVNFPIEEYVDFAPLKNETLLLIHELNDEIFRKTLGLEPLPEKKQTYTKEDYLRDYDLSTLE